MIDEMKLSQSDMMRITMFFLCEQIPNGLGALLSAVQLILYFIYYRTTPKEDESKQNLELPEVIRISAPDTLSSVKVEK